MSIGDLKDYGNKGNNFPWQLKMLKGLQGIINVILSNVAIKAGINNVVGINSMDLYIGATSKLLTLSIYNQDTTVSILVSTDNGVTYVSVPPGVTINYDAAGLLNYFDPSRIYINQNSATLNPLIIYTYVP